MGGHQIMAVPSDPVLWPGLIKVIRRCQSEASAVGVRGQRPTNSTFIYPRIPCRGNISLRSAKTPETICQV